MDQGNGVRCVLHVAEWLLHQLNIKRQTKTFKVGNFIYHKGTLTWFHALFMGVGLLGQSCFGLSLLYELYLFNLPNPLPFQEYAIFLDASRRINLTILSAILHLEWVHVFNDRKRINGEVTCASGLPIQQRCLNLYHQSI